MAVSSIKDFWIHPNALTITLNYFGDPQLIQTSMLAGAVIMAYRKDVITYDAAHNFREWKLQAFPTQLNDTCTYYVHAELSRSGDTAMIIYSPVKRDIEGRTLLRVEKDENGRDVEVWDNNLSTESYFIYLGTISASVDNDGATVERFWTDGFYTGTLDTDQQRMEEASGEWKTMFNYNDVIGQIEPLKPFSKIKVMGEAIFQSIAQFVNGLVIGKRTITDVAASSDSGNESKVSDATLPTTGYVQKEIEALDDHFLIKDDADAEQSVAGPVTFEQDVTVQGDHAVEGVQTIGKGEPGNINVEKVVQEVKGKQILHGGFQTPNFNNAAGQITGAHLTPDGKLYVSGLKANNFEIDELIFNVVKAQGGEYVYSTSCEIESCIYVMKDGSQLTPDAFYALPDHDWQQIAHVLITLKEDEFTQYGNPFVVGDIIYGKVNKVHESGKHAVGGECIMHITEVEDNTLNITAQLYQVGEHGLVGNIPPIEDMVIAHRGNKDGVQGRTTSFYLSTITGNLVMLYNVTTPTLSVANYGATFGKLPYDLYVQVLTHYAGLQPDYPAVYAKLLVTENWIQMDHLGQPIKLEVYRGNWRYDVAASDKPYIVTPGTYDTVTHNGAKWRVVTSNTVTEPRDGYGDWERLTDANITVYALAPSSNIIYIRDAGVITPSELDVTVKSTTSLGEEVIADQATLVGRNLTVWYTIDGGSERKMLVLGGTKVFVTEDGSSVFTTEAQTASAPLYLEGESIDLMQVADNITLYLVENYPDNPVDRASYVIPVVKDGAAPLGLEVTPSALSVPVDATTLATAGVRDYESTVRIKQGVSYIDDISEYTMQLTYTLRSGEVGTSNILDTDYIVDDWSEGTGWKIYVQSGNGIVKNKQIERIDISILHGEDVIATGAILFNYLERGITGPAGKDGPFLYPAGTWQEGAEYKFTYQLDSNGNIVNDSDNNPIVIAKPFVYYKSPEEAENYYVLEKNVPEGRNIAVTNTEYWKPFTKIQYIFTEALMANWARLGGTNGAYFWGNYMFSTRGIDNGGNSIDIPAFAESMFTDGKLNGLITPNLFLDFYSGEVKMNRLSMPFFDLPYGGDAIAYKMKLGVSHNVKADIGKIVFLPNPSEIKSADGTTYDDTILSWQETEGDGVLCTIMAKPKPYYTEKYKVPLAKFNMHKWPDTIPAITSLNDNLTLVCADGRIADYRSYDANNQFNPLKQDATFDTFGQYDGRGYFLIEGVPVKFIVLEPGAILKLRSCYTTAGRYYIPATGNGYAKETEAIFWVVENASDFGQINFSAQTYPNGASGAYVWSCPSNPDGDSPQYEIAYGSSFIRYVQSRGTDSLQGSTPLMASFSIDPDDSSNESVVTTVFDTLFIDS